MPQRPERPLHHARRLSRLPGAGGACARLCEPRRLKFYFAPQGGAKACELADLFLDPDEDGLHDAQIGSTKLLNQMSESERAVR